MINSIRNIEKALGVSGPRICLGSEEKKRKSLRK